MLGGSHGRSRLVWRSGCLTGTPNPLSLLRAWVASGELGKRVMRARISRMPASFCFQRDSASCYAGARLQQGCRGTARGPGRNSWMAAAKRRRGSQSRRYRRRRCRYTVVIGIKARNLGKLRRGKHGLGGHVVVQSGTVEVADGRRCSGRCVRGTAPGSARGGLPRLLGAGACTGGV